MTSSSPHSPIKFQLWGQLEVGLLASSHTNQCQHYFQFIESITPRAMGSNPFNHPWQFQVSYVFLPPTLVKIVLSTFLAEDITDQFKLLLLIAPLWLEDLLLPTILNMLADIPH